MPFRSLIPSLSGHCESLFSNGPMGFAKTLLQALGLWFWTTLWLFALISAMCMVLSWTTGDRLLMVRLGRYLLPWLWFALLAGLVPALLFQRFWLAAVLAVPALFIGFGYLPLFLPRTAPPADQGMPLKVISFNVWSENLSMLPTARLIGKNGPDILLLQEISPKQLQELTRELENTSEPSAPQWQVAYAPRPMQAVLSRYPLTQLGSDEKLAKMQKVRVETAAGAVTIFNVHPLRGNWKRRHRRLATLLQKHILTTEGPVILGGDLNTTDRSQSYRMLSRKLRNAHWEAGRSFGFTYPAHLQAWDGYLPAWDGFLPAWPLVRIDHIFYNPSFQAISAQTLQESCGSDHLPVMAELMLLEDPEK